LLSWLFAKAGVTLPTYFGALILAAIVRNTIGLIRYKENGEWVKVSPSS
jgi:ESS family glutamate:Na+ symporter